MKNAKHLRIAFLFLLGLAISFVPLKGAAQPEKSKSLQEKVLESWRARERACTSFKIRWKETQTFLKGSLTNPKTPKGLVLPPEDTETDAFYTLCTDGNKMRIDSKAMEISKEQEMKRQSNTSVFNGEINKTFRPAQINDHPQGYIGDEKHLPGLNVYNLRPVLILFRPFRYEQFGYFKDEDFLKKYNYEASGQIRGHKCIIARETDQSRSVYQELWLDPEREFIPLREVVFLKGNPMLQFDWEDYKKDDASIWVPVTWKIQEIQGGVKKAFVSRVLEFSANRPISSAEFDLEFPPGTWVIDRRTKDKDGNPSHYITKASGKRIISREDLSTKTYEELNQETDSKILWIIFGLIAAAGAVLIVFLYKWRRKHVPS